MTEFHTRATAREKQREAVAAAAREERRRLQQTRQETEAAHARLLRIALPLVLLVASAFVGLLSWLNVRERRAETGLFRALGKSTTFILARLLGRPLLVGAAGGAVGVALGWLIARYVTASTAPDTFAPAPTDPALIAGCLLGAPLVAAMAGYLPVLAALRRDPAAILNEPAG